MDVDEVGMQRRSAQPPTGQYVHCNGISCGVVHTGIGTEIRTVEELGLS